MSDKIDFMISDERDKWLNQSDEELFRSCGMEAFKGSGSSGEWERLEYKRGRQGCIHAQRKQV